MLDIDTNKITTAHTVAEFERWVANSRPGDICEYAYGSTTLQRSPIRIMVDGKWQKTEVAEMAWQLGTAILDADDKKQSRGLGVVELVQQRRSIDNISYLAIKREFALGSHNTAT